LISDIPTIPPAPAEVAEQARINTEGAEAEAQLGTEGEKLKQTNEVIDLALDLAYRKPRPEVRKLWNRTFLQRIRIGDGKIADFEGGSRSPLHRSSVHTRLKNCGPEGMLFELPEVSAAAPESLHSNRTVALQLKLSGGRRASSGVRQGLEVKK
jgi:hypothetical protein